jgi:hypothetical protein
MTSEHIGKILVANILIYLISYFIGDDELASLLL